MSGFYIDKALKKEIETFAKKSGVNKVSPALRMLLRVGLKHTRELNT